MQLKFTNAKVALQDAAHDDQSVFLMRMWLKQTQTDPNIV